jgi:hypothetical protein
MIGKSTILAIVAAAALGITMLTPDVASARGFHGGGGGHRAAMGGGHRGGFRGGMHRGFRGGVHRGGFHRRHVGGFHRFQRRHRWHRWPRWRHRHWGHCWRHPYRWGCRRHVWYYPRPVIYSGYSVARPVAPCTCLSKEYTPEGAVLFKDNCTNEAAINPPPVAPAAEVAPQVPQAAYVPQYPPQAAPAN